MIPMFMSYDNEMQNKSSLAGNFQSFRIFRQIESKFMLVSAAAAIQVFRNKRFMFDEIFQKLPIYTHIPSFFSCHIPKIWHILKYFIKHIKKKGEFILSFFNIIFMYNRYVYSSCFFR